MLHGCAFTSFTDPQSFYSSHRIVGGIEAPDGSAPYMVALLVGDIVPSLLCGGSLIAPQRMLTAAHCIEPMKSWTGGLLPRAVLGTNKWSDERRTAQFSGYRIHPEYDRWNIKNDIGLIFTTNEVVLDKRLWGEIPDQLQLLYVKVMSPSLCEHAVKEAQGELRYPPVNHEVEICTKHEKGAGHGMCHGDSGSALVDELALPSAPAEEVDFFVHADQNARIVGGTQAPEGSVPYMVALSNGLLVRSFLCGGSLISTRTVLTAAHCIDAVFSLGSLSNANVVTSNTVAFVPLSFAEAGAGVVSRVAGWGRIRGDSGSALVRVDNSQQIGIVSWGFPCARGAPDMFVRVSAYRDWLLTHVV
ncbi:hypothetical protein MSG28_004458 [Choristoneura fumiferana]|uniref:Uncharacterized protein n=2 Tax=Choristoneura fumiferana TaxID=7141 RepID=A0ACC0K5Z4_CHOFU|nr:hypothetical protein MSG28_004458 [Choristoneura fumiferana]KAI8431906.1 hypothetical protein MSG28_004458 [Choristoneura fumiferana]